MPEIRPFRAVRYPLPDASAVVAPPYDVLAPADRQRLLARSEHNIVEVDLPVVPAKAAGPPEAYAQAGERYRQWVQTGVLRRDQKPAFYVYHQVFREAGRLHTRRMFFARLRLEEFGQGRIFPHEQTFGGPKEDRLMLMRATRANLSPIFGLYPDPANEVAAVLDAATHRAPDAVALADDVENRLWAVSDPGMLDRVQALMADKPVFIADGHHRYGTALMYSAETSRAAGNLPPDHPANFVLCVLAGMEDPGLLILPTHRVLCGVRASSRDWSAALSERFDLTPADNPDGAALLAALSRHGPQAMAAYCAADRAAVFFRPRDPDLLAAFEPRRSPAWRRYGLAILHRCVIDELVTPRLCGGATPTIHYVKDAAAAVAEADAEPGVAVLVQPTTMAELRDICTAGELMPQKSTYFFPKLATGLVIHPLDE